ncbi:FAD-dependent oxidoreductase [Thermomonas sp. HDW16]|uniref:FAD-dependent oxidoreductase n=1 Tax=Thermomonas sp. HDW16 TaxID=2714945 RepID=UPI00140E02E5|nr:FAD-dependent oxidoreductase [Thermomonas sp. HDW16]QIL21328.1 UbiH/UbiF family hydroxylase [Thermomonas sp. HDW16]
MNRRGLLDAVIAGGGVVGAATALMLAREGLQVALVEPKRPDAWRRDARDLRVYAFAPDNARLLGDLGVWPQIVAARAQPYRGMRVWDAAGDDALTFDADALGQRQLGWIVENALLVDALWQALPAAGVRLHCPARIESLEQAGTGVRLQLDDGLALEAKLAIAADGANSALRDMAGIGTRKHDYAQKGLVAFVASETPHRQTCWQRFLPSGPVAFLPFADDGDAELQGRVGSIVWTLPNDEAERLRSADAGDFERQLEAAFGGELGAMRLLSPRAAFPLQRQLADTYLKGRVLLLGDAAHAVHPLAGQGVNLGLRDVAALRELVRAGGFASSNRLARWARTRKSENAVNAHAFETINRVYSNDGMWPTLLRGHALGIAGKLPPLSRALWRHAAGI